MFIHPLKLEIPYLKSGTDDIIAENTSYYYSLLFSGFLFVVLHKIV